MVQPQERPVVRPVQSDHRVLAGIAVFLVVLVLLGLSLSDRVPDLFASMADRLAHVGGRIQDRFALDLVDRGDVPLEGDQIAHLFMWTAATTLLGLAIRRVALAELAALLFMFGVTIEILQATTTASRNFSVDDISFNALGIMVGLCVTVVLRRMATLWAKPGS